MYTAALPTNLPFHWEPVERPNGWPWQSARSTPTRHPGPKLSARRPGD